jgi:ubiquinone/menaquinone biosynthesis C-methylase UbiE
MNQSNHYEPSNWSVYMQQALRPISKRYLYNQYVNSLPLRPDSKILEFGSGIGVMAELFARRLNDGELTCVDISDRYLSKARKNLRDYPNTSFVRGRLTKLNIEESEYDAINIHFVLHDIEKKDREQLICEMYRLLKPGGKVFVREPLKESHGMPAAEINELFLDAGFYPVYEEDKKVRFRGEIFSACYARLSTIQFFFS